MSTTNKSYRDVPVADLVPGDTVTNLGMVEAVGRIGLGSFVAVAVRGTEWSLASGKATNVAHDVIFHAASEVTIERWEDQ